MELHQTGLSFSQHPSAGHRVTAIHTPKFKTMTLAWYFERPLDDLAPVYALGVRLMVRAFGGDDPMGINRKLQGMYGAYLQADTVKYGDLQSLQIKLTFVSDHHVPHGIAEEAIGYFMTIFNEPVIEFAGFDQLVHLEKGNLISAIAQREQDKSSHTYDSLLKALFPESPFGNTAYGNQGEVRLITTDQVKLAIQDMIASKPYSLKVIGDMDMETIASMLTEDVPKRDAQVHFSTTPDTSTMVAANWVVHESIEQTKLALAYSLGHLNSHREYYSAILLGHLLGGGPSALLFQEIREKRGLAYSVHGRVDKFLGLLTIHAGLKLSHTEEVKTVVVELLNALKTGSIDVSALERSKKMLLGSYFALADTPVGCLNFVHSQGVAKLPESFEEVTQIVNEIDSSDISNIANKLRFVGGYTLAPKEKNHD